MTNKERIQRVVAEILTQFMFTKDMDDMVDVWNNIFAEYELYYDPFTDTPCSAEEYQRNRAEYDRQTMVEKYGHCDGLE